jgi:hypothetical protein
LAARQSGAGAPVFVLAPWIASSQTLLAMTGVSRLLESGHPNIIIAVPGLDPGTDPATPGQRREVPGSSPGMTVFL